MTTNVITHGNNIKVLQTYPDNSIDSVVTDAPYGLGAEPDPVKVMQAWATTGYYEVKGKGFMGKAWDAFVPQPAFWKEVFRVLKPGGHVLCFFGTRTYDWGVMAIRFAGFEIRDCLQYLYGSGFPKSLSISKALDAEEKKYWNDLCKSIDSLDFTSIFNECKEALNIANNADVKLEKNQIETGINMLKKDFAAYYVQLSFRTKKEYAHAIIAELNLIDLYRILNQRDVIAQESAEISIKQLHSHATLAEKPLQNQKAIGVGRFYCSRECQDLLNENSALTTKAEEALMTLRGNKSSLKKETINALFAEVINDLKLTILNHSSTFRSLGMTLQMDYACAMTVITTKCTEELLITSMENTLKEICKNKGSRSERHDSNIPDAAKQGDGWGTALKPAVEPIVLARKPIEGTVAQNVMKYGTGGLNIDGCRVGIEERYNTAAKSANGTFNCSPGSGQEYLGSQVTGRFPSNVLLDEEAAQALDEQTGTLTSGMPIGVKSADNNVFGQYGKIPITGYGDTGGASRFFYTAKASKDERERGVRWMNKRQGYKNIENCPTEILNKVKQLLGL